jgi:DNA-binding response OmpR family regulator
MKILIVEDDESIAQVLETILTKQNYVIEVAVDGQKAWDLIEAFDYDLLILDVKLPKLDGISLCRRIRSKKLSLPIMLLTACGSSHEKAIGLDAGADDYVVKPFVEEELVARVRALLRRGSVSSQPILTWGKLSLDPTSCKVTYENEALPLTPKEIALLELFLRNSRRVFSCGMILEHLWSYETVPGEEAVRTHIKGLRQKLKRAGLPHDSIETVYGIGYRLKPLPSLPSDNLNSSDRQEIVSNSTTDLSIQQQTKNAIAQIWEKFKDRISQQVSTIENAANALQNGNLSPELSKNALEKAHSLAGALGSFGFPHGSQLARQIEQILKGDSLLNTEQQKNLTQLVSSLRKEIDREPTLETEQKEINLNSQKPLLLIVDRDRNLAEQIERQASQSGWQTKLIADLNNARESVERAKPDVVLLEPNISDNIEDSLQILTELNQTNPSIPIFVFTDKSDLNYRLQMAKVGTQGFLPKSTPIELVVETVKRISEQAKSTEATILAVDDDPQILALLKELLAPWGVKVVTLEDPRYFWEELEAIAPELLILDIEMPYLKGIELCQVVRNDPRWSDLPVIFLTMIKDSETIDRVFSIGADDFISKPIVSSELITRIINRLERLKLTRRMTKISEGYPQNSENRDRTNLIQPQNISDATEYSTEGNRQEMEKMKDEFISIVSHEIRTPLTSIYGALVMLNSGLLKTESQQQRMLKIASDSTERLVRLINDILDIERIELGKVKMQKRLCRIADIIDEAVEMVRLAAERENVTLSVDCRELQVRADPDRIVQIFTNLLSNAIKFSPPNATIWIDTEVINDKKQRALSLQYREANSREIEEDKERLRQEDGKIYESMQPIVTHLLSSQHILFTIRDRGRGIPENKLEKIFERFQQVDSSDSRDRDGTGLGLAICRSIVQQHGGNIWVESSLGEGSTFYFTLPVE